MYKSVNICLLIKRACCFILSYFLYDTFHPHFPSFGLNFCFVKLSCCVYPVVVVQKKRDRKAYSKSQTRSKKKENESLSEATTKKSISHFLNAFSEIIQQNIYPLEAHQTHTSLLLSSSFHNHFYGKQVFYTFFRPRPPNFLLPLLCFFNSRNRSGLKV